MIDRLGSRPVTRSGVSPIGPLRALSRLRDLVRALCRRSLGRFEQVRQVGRRPLSRPTLQVQGQGPLSLGRGAAGGAIFYVRTQRVSAINGIGICLWLI